MSVASLPTTAAAVPSYRAAPPPRPSRMARVVWALSGLNLATVIAGLLLLFVVSERWWLGTVLTYLPRAPWAVPSILLALAGLFWHRPSLWANVLALLLILGPVMEFRAPWLADARSGPPVAAAAHSLRFVSANVQGYKPDFAGVLTEVAKFKPDVVVLQEARGEHRLLVEFFPDWHRLHVDYFWIGSRYPLTLKHTCQTAAFDRVTGLVAEIETPDGPVIVADVHQMTARRGLLSLSPSELVSGAAQSELEEFQMLRMAESAELREQIRQHNPGLPLIVAGDFNTPASSSLFQREWGDLTSAYDIAGTGYGYTSPVKAQSYWLSYVPWARIDHILCSPDWHIRDCRIGAGRGSDHHLIYAELVLPRRAPSVSDRSLPSLGNVRTADSEMPDSGR
ncbi:MAG: endonuclease/exonuclease/phosphatase family protein [Planctomycetaceae bacterium]|nr:endonuclease/exonuclease/phosphatase family protein [Planctomycetaceae bacterium]